jgi:hypothetical protein
MAGGEQDTSDLDSASQTHGPQILQKSPPASPQGKAEAIGLVDKKIQAEIRNEQTQAEVSECAMSGHLKKEVTEVDACMSRASGWKHARLTCEDQHKRESVRGPSMRDERPMVGLAEALKDLSND